MRKPIERVIQEAGQRLLATGVVNDIQIAWPTASLHNARDASVILAAISNQGIQGFLGLEVGPHILRTSVLMIAILVLCDRRSLFWLRDEAPTLSVSNPIVPLLHGLLLIDRTIQIPNCELFTDPGFG
jgi:hypothetical protein